MRACSNLRLSSPPVRSSHRQASRPVSPGCRSIGGRRASRQRCPRNLRHLRNLRSSRGHARSAQRHSDAARMRQAENAMDRRDFVRLLAVAPFVRGADTPLPKLKVVSSYHPAGMPGMPGPYPGTVIAVSSDRCVDVETNAANAEVVREMMAQGMCALTGATTPLDAWRRFFVPTDVVGIKVNCGGYPNVVSDYYIVAESIRQLMARRRAADADLDLRALPESARRGELPAARCPMASASSPPSARTGTPTTTATIRRPTSRPTSSAKKTRART